MKALGVAISRGKIGKTHKGAPHSEETKRHLSEIAGDGRRKGAGNAMFGKNHSDSAKTKMSETRSRKIIDGEYDRSKWAKRGELFAAKANRLIPYHSSFEKKAIEILESDRSVISFEFEPLRIPYYFGLGGDGYAQRRYYIPDFFVSYESGSNVIIEVKPECYLDAAMNIAKFAAAKEFCSLHDFEFRVWTQKDLS